jgi:CheY-like chemotaxis protein
MEALGAQHGENVDQILKAGRHLLSLIEEVLDISRIEAGTMRFSLEPVDIFSALGDVAALIAPVAESAGIKLLVDLEPGSEVFALADRQRLRQVILNLLSNAVKYNQPGGTVTLSVDSDGDRVGIKVADTGPGIAPDKLERLFVAFDRLDAEQGNVQGTGLGLALSKSLVEGMGGTIVADSSVGDGSVFTVELIVTPNPVTADTLSSAREAGRHSKAVGAQTILYIEDNPSNATLVEQAFTSQPEVQLVQAMLGGTGIELAKAHRPDLILLDLNLPDMHGSVVLELLRADPDTAEIPVIVLSADATQSQIRALMRAGARAYLTKPLNVPVFLGEVGQHLPERVGS